ncbi:mediator complex subunit 23-domain-containing protein [Jimgerdemannia flammicorona]|uniref:Mediator complex subunit 23-domain-containing protein n=1 Tax=Jimgerdemannia flammicorona TaxID=994334 RepID=A0A433QVY5_9FUNG|nr:mediator complex subunit 23-domain-containing protein [Jimgerdemannia flammicorona]
MKLIVQKIKESIDSESKIRFLLNFIQTLLIDASSDPISTPNIVGTPASTSGSAFYHNHPPSFPVSLIFKHLREALDINCHQTWSMIITFLLSLIDKDPVRTLEAISSADGVDIIKHVMLQINTLPPSLSRSQTESLNKGMDLINALLVGPQGDGAGCVSHYDIIVALPKIYGNFSGGTFEKSIHWTMERFVNELSKRRRHLVFLMMPPDASWPLISQISRRHEYNDLTTRLSYHMFEGDLINFIKEGNSTCLESHFRDMLFQRASMDEYRQLSKSPSSGPIDTSQIRRAMVAKIRAVVRCIQERSKFDEPRQATHDAPAEMKQSDLSTPSAANEETDMLIPENIDLWEMMIETADQLYSFVAADFFTYESILQDFYQMVSPESASSSLTDTKRRLRKDNSLIWLLLQLFHIEKIGSNVIAKDLAGDERLFDMLVKLYNEKQIISIDAFSLRDLALPCAINHQKPNIRDLTTIRQRHPQITHVLPYATICNHLQQYFSNQYYSNATNHGVFRNLQMQEIIKISMESQLRQNLVPNTLYVYLVPNMVDLGKLAFPKATYLKGGALGHKLLDFLNVSAKHRLLQLIYKMMLDSDSGPQFQSDTSSQVNCVSPYVLDVVYKLLYSAPCSADLMVKEILDKLRRCDKSIKTRAAGGPAVPDHTLRWLHTVLQLLNYRFLRFLKYSSLSFTLLYSIRYSISSIEHRQIYFVLESFAVNVMRMQIDIKVLRTLDDRNRDKPIWFAESEMLARVMVLSIGKLIKTRGQADLPTEMIHRVLHELYPYRLEWSEQTLHFLPEVVRSFYIEQPSTGNTKPALSQQKIKPMSSNNPLASYLLGQGTIADERNIKERYSLLENQPNFLCIVWTIALMKSVDAISMSSVRKILLMFPASRMASYTLDLVDFILEKEYSDPVQSFTILDRFIWKYQILDFNHVIFALVRGHIHPSRVEKTFNFLEYLLVGSLEFSNRFAKWIRLDFSYRYWTEDDHHDKLMQYLKEFPEFFEYEAYAMNGYDGYDRIEKTLDPPCSTQMPVYYTNAVIRFFPIFDTLLGRLIEYQQVELLIKILEKYECLYYYHHYQLSFVRGLLHNYFTSPVLKEPRVMKHILKLLDFTQHELAPEIKDYATNENASDTVFDSAYFERVVNKLAQIISYFYHCPDLSPQKSAPKSNPSLPERHFREIANPAVQAMYNASVEIMAAPVPPSQIVRYILDLALVRGDHSIGISAMTMHAIGLLIASLPVDDFVMPIWVELIHVIRTDPYLLENSEPCTLIQCELLQSMNGAAPWLQDLANSRVLRGASTTEAHLAKTKTFTYTFNDYTFNCSALFFSGFFRRVLAILPVFARKRYPYHRRAAFIHVRAYRASSASHREGAAREC